MTGGNFRLLSRLLTQMERILEVNALQEVTKAVVEAAREGLVCGEGLNHRDFAADALKKSVDQLSIENLDAPLVLAFLDSVESRQGCSPATRNARLAAIDIFFSFLAREEPSLIPQLQTVRSIPRKRTVHKEIGYLEEREMQSLLNTVNLSLRNGIRDKALLMLFYNTGARVSEIVEQRITDLRLDTAGQVRLPGKGKKFRSCPLWPETVDSLKAYLEQRDLENIIDYVHHNPVRWKIVEFPAQYRWSSLRTIYSGEEEYHGWFDLEYVSKRMG